MPCSCPAYPTPTWQRSKGTFWPLPATPIIWKAKDLGPGKREASDNRWPKNYPSATNGLGGDPSPASPIPALPSWASALTSQGLFLICKMGQVMPASPQSNAPCTQPPLKGL